MATQDISQLVVEVTSKGIQTASNQLDKLAVSADKAEAAVKKLGTAVVGVNGVMSGGVAQTAALIGAMNALTVVMQTVINNQNRVTQSTRTSSAAMDEARAAARGLSGSLGALWVTYGNLAGMGVGIAIGASLKGVIGIGKDVEQTLESIRVLGGASLEDVAKMSAVVTDMGKGSQGPKDVAEALNVLTLAGLNAKEAMQGVGAALNLSVAGGVSIEKSAETLVQVSTALGYTADGFDHVADVVAKTAAASMSSVDSISNAFKSAAAVGEVYGASLQDIALGLAAVANLGIQGTSAGTALKNFYKDLSASTQKVTNTLRDMGMTIKDFRDAQGFMLPLVDVVKNLDKGFNSLAQDQKKLAEVKMFSQQGVREFAVLSKMLHTASTEVDEFGNKYANKLEETAGEIQKSAAFSTMAAIAMGQTTANQMKSVGNTIQTVFVDVFREVAPMIGEIARSLKTAFASDAFKSGLTTTISMIVSFTKAVVENIGVIKLLAGALIGMKVLEFGAGVLTAAKAFDVAAISAKGFWASLGPIGIAITGLIILWQTYKEYQDRALNNRAAANNLDEYLTNVQKAADKEKQLFDMREKGLTEQEVQRASQMADDTAASQLAIENSKKGTNAMLTDLQKQWAAMSENERMRANMIVQGKTQFGNMNTTKYVESLNAYNDAMGVQTGQVKKLKAAEQELFDFRAKNAAKQDEQAKANRFISGGDGQLAGKGDKAGDNARYAAELQNFQNDIKAALKDLANFREEEDAKFKSGQIGKLQQINETADAELAAYDKIAKAAKAQRDIAARTPNKQADVARFQGEIDRANSDADQAEKMRGQNTNATLRAMLAQRTAMQVKALEEEGKFKEAAELKWSTDGKIAWEQAKKDAEQYGSVYPWLMDLVNQYAANRDAAMNSAQLKEDALAFDTALLEVESTLKGVKSATFGTSIGTMMDTATKATEKFNVALEKAKSKRNALWVDALTTGSPEAIKKYEEANKDLLAIGDKQKTMWQEVGQTITSSLKDAFGSAGEALGKMNEAMIDYQQTENATAEDRMNQYGNMAQAASGFFDKQSKGYKVLNGIAQAFHIASMARTLAQTAASVAAGAAQFFAQSGWGGFAGVAAMGAVMAGLGYAMSGSGGSDSSQTSAEVQKKQGTGTVLGDATAKSNSIANSIDNLKSNSDYMLPLTQGMLQSLQNIEAAMNGLAGLAVQNGVTDGSNFNNLQTGSTGMFGGSFLKNTLMGTNAIGGAAGGAAIGFAMGGPIGAALGAVGGAIVGKIASLWGGTKKELVDAGLQFGGSVSDLQNGKGVDQYATVQTTKKSWFGLKKDTSTGVQTMGAGDEISRQFGLVFTNLETSLTSAASALGTTGEAVSKAIDGVVLATTKVSLKDLKGDELADALNNVLSAAMDQIAKAAYPQMEAFQHVGEGYAETVIRVASGVEQAGAALKQFGITAVNYTSLANKQGDVAFEVAKQSILAVEGLSGVGELLKNMTGSIDDLTTAYKALVDIRTQMNNLGLHGDKLGLGTLQGAGGASQLSSALKNYQEKYFTDAEKSAMMLKSVTDGFAKLNVALPASKAELRALIETTSASNPELTGQLLALADAYAQATDAAEEARNDQISGLEDTIDALKKFKDTIEQFRKGLLLGDLSPLTPEQKYTEAKGQYEDVMAKAMKGDATAKDQVTAMAQAYLEASRVVNASNDAYGATFAQVQKDMLDLEGATGVQISNAQKQLDALTAQLGALESLNTTASAILDSVSGTDSPVVVPVSPGALAVPVATTVTTDNSEVVEKLKDVIKSVAEGNLTNSTILTDLIGALYDSTKKAADTMVEGTENAAKTTAWTIKTTEVKTR